MLSLSLENSDKSEKQVYCCALNSDGVIAAGNSDGSTSLIQPDGKKVIKTHKYPVTAVCFTDKYLITASSDHSIILHDHLTGEVREKLMVHKGPIRCLCVSRDGSLLISGSSDQTIGITNILAAPTVSRHLKLWESDSGMLSGVCVSPDSSLVVSTATSGTIFLHDINNPKPRHCQVDCHEMGVNGCDITLYQDRNLLCSVGADYQAKLWYVDNFTLLPHKTLSGHSGQVLCTKFHVLPDGRRAVLTGSVDKSVIIWNIETGEKLHQSICHTSFIYSISVHDDKLVTCSSDKAVKQWLMCSGNVKTINVIPLASKNTLADWSNQQVKHWLERLVPESNSDLTGEELANLDLEELLNRLEETTESRSRLKQAILLLRAFDGVPDEFLCPVSMEIMTDPVVTNDGHTYERANISEWLSSGHNTSPFTNTTLSTKSLISNHNLRKLIETVFFLK